MIPVATTRVRTWRKDGAVSGAFAALEEGIRAVVSIAGGTLAGRTVGPGDSEVVRYTLLADPCDLQYLDEVEDEITGQRYQVEWAVASPGVAGELASVRAGLSTREGA